MADIHVLVADDDKAVVELLGDMLSRDGYDVYGAGNGREAVEVARRCLVDVAILDLKMPFMDGLQALREIKSIDQKTEVLIMTGHGDMESLKQILDEGGLDYILKPFRQADIIAAVRAAIRKRGLLVEEDRSGEEQKDRILHLEREFKHRTHELRESQIKYKEIVENSNDAIFIAQDGQFKFVNPTTLLLTGYNLEEIKTLPISDLIDPRDRAMVMDRHLRRLKGETLPSTYAFRALRKNGESFWVEINAIKTMWEGRPGTLNIVRDITERKRAEEALNESERRLRTILESVQTGIVIVDPETHIIVDANLAAARMIGVPREQVVGVGCRHFLCQGKECACPATGLRMNIENVQEELVSGRGEVVPILKSVVEVILDGKKRLLESFLDISELKEAQEQLTDAKESALAYSRELREALAVSESLRREMEDKNKLVDAANRAKDEFLANVSHELRSPMSVVIGMADLLWETPLTFGQKRFVEAIRSSGESLLELINDILDLSKAEAGHIELVKVPFNLMDVLKNTCEAQAFHTHKRDIELLWWVRPGVQTRLSGDPGRLAQILCNLIENAIKFTDRGEVYVEVSRHAVHEQSVVGDSGSRLERDTDGSVELLFSVTDTGIGISPDKQEAIFDRFTQTDSSITRRYGGTGLGLAICRRLTELMGGRIWVKSEVGRGSTFSFTARFEIQPGESSYQIPKADIAGKRILIIDDRAISRMVLSEMLAEWGAVVTGVEDGERGLEEMKRASDSARPYDLVFLDCSMPRLDGFEVLNRMKDEGMPLDPVILMLDLGVGRVAMEKAQALGIPYSLLKPIRWSDLKETVLAALGRKEIRPPEALAASQRRALKERDPLHILLVEDNNKIRELIQAFLKDTPCKLDTAENGEVGVKKFKTGDYDLVLMDIEMPLMDGYTATKEIRKWEADSRLGETPIIALTAHALAEHRQKSLDVGCTAHLSKPIKKADLIAAVEVFAPEGRSSATA